LEKVEIRDLFPSGLEGGPVPGDEISLQVSPFYRPPTGDFVLGKGWGQKYEKTHDENETEADPPNHKFPFLIKKFFPV
jgi:hypothetical protein